MVRSLYLLMTAFICFMQVSWTFASGDSQLTRDEVTVIKRKLTAVIETLGLPPAGYSKEEESFSLPTDASRIEKTGTYYPVHASAHMKFGSEKAARRSGKELETEYRKKMMEAQARGDYQLMGQVAQEMQQKAAQAQVDAETSRKEPIEITVQFNSNPGQTIDPDAVVFEKPGVIALRFSTGGEDENGRIAVYFDPVHLKDTKTLSRVDLSHRTEKGVSKKTAVLNATIELTGPSAAVEAWARQIATARVLAQIDGR